jgi:lipopolysaccharide/colanic/teichoic acid biosynthesis glycosyltransferase
MQLAERVIPRFERQHRLAIAAAIAAIDALLLWFAFWLAYELRYGYELGGDVFPWDQQSFSAYYQRAALFVLLSLGILLLRGAYRLPVWTSLLDEGMLIGGSVTVAMGALVLTNYLSQFSPSRLVFVYAWALAIIFLMAFRLARRGIRQALWARSIGVERLLIVGSGDPGRRIAQAVLAAPDAGLRIAGYVDEPDQQRMMQFGSRHGLVSPQRLGGVSDIPALLNRHRIDQVIIALDQTNQTAVAAISELCHVAGVRFHVVPDLLQLSFERAELSELAGVPLLGIRQAAITGTNATIKRVFDLGLVVPMLVAASIPMGVAWLRRDRSKAFLAGSEKVGRNGMLFQQLRFSSRSGDGDSSSVSRLPQLLNVLKGEMSLVGPLAQSREEVAQYDAWHLVRLKSTPGITGLWAVQGRHDLTFDEMARLDLFYAEHWSLWLDIKILLRSLPRLWGA